jgi:hypothetical protein
VNDTLFCRTVDLELPQMTQIHSTSMRVSGITEVSSIWCQGGAVGPWPTVLMATMVADATGRWLATEQMPMESGPFAWTSEFSAPLGSNPTWDFLLDGAAQLEMYGEPDAYMSTCTPTAPDPTIDLTEAVLVIDADFVVPTLHETWGAIKATFSRK